MYISVPCCGLSGVLGFVSMLPYSRGRCSWLQKRRRGRSAGISSSRFCRGKPRSAMARVALAVMYQDESVDAHGADGSRLRLAPCGSEFVAEKRGRDPQRVRQRTRFATSEYKALLLLVLEFRNRYATRPYLPEELIPAEKKKWLLADGVSEMEWPGEDPGYIEVTQDGEMVLRSKDGGGKLILSSSGEDFTMEYDCRVSQSEMPKALENMSSESQASDKNGSHTVTGPSVRPSSQRMGAARAFTSVVQHHSCLSYPDSWQRPLSAAAHHRMSLRSGTTSSRPSLIQSGHNPHPPLPLPLRCSSPHLHRWNASSRLLDHEEPFEAMETDLVKVVCCHGIIYRIIEGTIPIVEVCPGDGSLMRSKGVLVNYFTHYQGGSVPGETVEKTYYLKNLPPDVPGQMYSVSSVVTRASRILKCYCLARDSVKLPYMNCCWHTDHSFLESLKLVQEASLPGSGHFMAFSDGSAEIVFGDGARLYMMWNFSKSTYSQNQTEGARSSWCQLTLPSGQQQLVNFEAPGPYLKYVALAADWSHSVQQTCLERGSGYSSRPSSTEIGKHIESSFAGKQPPC
ncbi:uncharacterized protein C5orf34 homolog isoform X2 [Denticeps clupeoides]|uniref:uncharacterized protein C5orf34 homolog isoform X2 n=1 Tax=Denticeps clupeoides TaxID=299321 RepID=UPI0010A48EFE|nr:uncharacterized protein C5orf34 homolog isoform X2 [Denticeps clupeoides]